MIILQINILFLFWISKDIKIKFMVIYLSKGLFFGHLTKVVHVWLYFFSSDFLFSLTLSLVVITSYICWIQMKNWFQNSLKFSIFSKGIKRFEISCNVIVFLLFLLRILWHQKRVMFNLVSSGHSRYTIQTEDKLVQQK